MTIDIDSLISNLFCARRTREPISSLRGDRSWQAPILSEDDKPYVERIIHEWYNNQVTEEGERIAKLEAKVHVYEKIISKSNFAPMLVESTRDEESGGMEIEETPAEDVEQVKYGTWVYGEYKLAHCSECGFGQERPWHVTPFCPGCGAKMDGGGEE